MSSSKPVGFRGRQRQLAKATAAIDQVENHVAALPIDFEDPDAEGVAIREIEETIDRVITPYDGNDHVAALAEQAKATFADMIRTRIEVARTQR